tara:strand:- start:533 stop:787 length:255 start_codon:yes stop_codon:yes gene_type:complete
MTDSFATTSKQQEKRARFARMFPARVDTLRDTLRKIANCSNKGNYEWDAEKVQKAWELIALEFADTADKYGISFEVHVTATTRL